MAWYDQAKPRTRKGERKMANRLLVAGFRDTVFVPGKRKRDGYAIVTPNTVGAVPPNSNVTGYTSVDVRG